MIPEGKYKARAALMHDNETGQQVYARIGYSSGGTECVEVRFKLEGGEEKLWKGWLTDKTIKRTMKALRHLGSKSDDLRKLGEQKLENEVEVEVKHESYKGTTDAKIDRINPLTPGESSVDELAERVLRVLAGKQSKPQDTSFDLPADDELPF